MHEYLITHEHEYGTTIYLLKTNHPKLYVFTGDEAMMERLADHMDIDYEPHKDEVITITPMEVVTTVEEPFIMAIPLS